MPVLELYLQPGEYHPGRDPLPQLSSHMVSTEYDTPVDQLPEGKKDRQKVTTQNK
jgi:hypothetical protein